ncbi:hypothetical protein HanLR1_Chr12g0446581 [Helianthus annuus]|nr:hypothetical protein HanHA89_Chr12g0469551 [Helianthus annuus]KAJ0675028.1 hypothetical protein HanLR1_Chr12g0446581 [Helianthus annuus]
MDPPPTIFNFIFFNLSTINHQNRCIILNGCFSTIATFGNIIYVWMLFGDSSSI